MPSPLLILAIPLLAALLVGLFRLLPRAWAGACGPLIAILFGAGSVMLMLVDGQARTFTFSLPWVPQLGFDFALRMTPFGAWFGAIILGLAACIQLYASTYFAKDARRPVIQFYLSLFTGAMLGVIWSDNFYLLFLFWEATSALSFLLVGFNHTKADAREKSSQALLVTLTGGAAMLVGFILLQSHFGTSSLTELLDRPSIGEVTPLLTTGMLLVILGAFTKSAQWPFHFWLPNAMAGPTPVSAFLHSATMVKAGVFLLATLAPLFSQHPVWTPLLTLCGFLTVCVAVTRAIRENDLKSILASTTLAALGFLTILAGIGSPAALLGFVIFLTAHALYKAPLFLAAGNLEKRFGTRDIRELRGAFYGAPVTGSVILISIFSLLGVAPLPGFLGKEYLLKAAWYYSPLVAVAIAIGAAGVLGLGLRIAIPLLRRKNRAAPQNPLPFALTLATGLPALGALVLTFSLPLANHAFLGPAASALGAAEDASYKLWHGWTPALGLGISALLLSLVITKIISRPDLAPLPMSFQPLFERLFNLIISSLKTIAKDVAQLLEGAKLNVELGFILSAVGLLVLVSLGTNDWPAISFAGANDSAAFFLLAPMIAGASIVAALTRQKLMLLVSLGFVGLLVAFLFLWFSAPDLSLTQLLAETLLLFLLAVALTKVKLPEKKATARGWRAMIAVASGLIVTLLIMKSLALEWDHPVSAYHLTEAKASAYGANVVNVILVDFRALDTLGEIVVLAIAALGATSALGAARKRVVLPGDTTTWLNTGLPLVMTTLTIAALWIFWRGHNHSGGGFIGALMLASAVGLGILSRGKSWHPRRLRHWSRTLLILGVSTALVSALLPLTVGKAFFTGLWWHSGDFHIGTPVLFDLGVMLAVLGFALQYLRHFYSIKS